MASPHNRVSILNQCTMDPHIGGFLEPFIGDNKSFDFQHDENHRNSNEKATKIIGDIENLKNNFIELLDLATKNIKNEPASAKVMQTVVDTFEMMSP